MNFPAEELALINLTVKMFTEPRLLGDQEMLCQAMTSEQDKKQSLLSELGCSKKELGSNSTFSRLLEALGIEVEWKSGKNGPIPAFAKTDQFMQDLLLSNDARVVDLVEAKLACRSSIDETRAGRLYEMSCRGGSLFPRDDEVHLGTMPVYLNYCGAHTTRWSGGDAVNWQNLPKQKHHVAQSVERRESLGELASQRCAAVGGSSPSVVSIRQAIHAPPGYVIGKVDASQQEARILDTIAGQWDSVEKWRAGVDQYCGLASGIFGILVNKKEHPGERQCGKRIKLSAGFGAGHVKMLHTLKGDMKQYGIDYEVTPEIAEKGIQTYRATHPKVVQLWKNCDFLLHCLAGGTAHDAPFGLPIEIKNHQIICPNGAPMTYWLEWMEFKKKHGLVKQSWGRKTREGWRPIWGGGLTENIVQALGRVAVGQAVLRVEKRLGLKPVNLEHDAAIWLIPEAGVADYMDILVEEMRRVPAWLPDCPFDAEGHYARSYG